MKEEKQGKISEIIFHNEENFYSILLFETNEEQFFAVGNIPNPKMGRTYRLLGDWTKHPKYGEQFKFSSFEELEPTTEEGIAAFLSSGVIRGIGPKVAQSIVRYFGKDTLEIIRTKPHLLENVPGIGKAKAKAIEEGYKEHREYADTVLALSEFDIGTNVCLKLYKAFGADAVNVVKENPYSLIDEVYGIGFKRADKIAASVGFASDSPYRIKSAALYMLGELAAAGDSYANEASFIEQLAQFLDVTRDKVSEGIFELIMDGSICKERLNDENILMLYMYNRAEKYTASKIYQLCNAELRGIAVSEDNLIKKAEKESGKNLSEQQKLAVVSSLRNGVNIITGGPGTGKTTIINMILAILNAADFKTALAAPTGRAAKRMQAAANFPATTIHRLLEYNYEDGEDRMVFGRNEENPLDADCIIIDEVSMVDILLMEALLRAIKPGTRLIMVGDADQLPPVGAGNVLKDMLACEYIHATRLTEIFRQAEESAIVVNAHLINKGEYPCCNEKDSDFFMLQRQGEKSILNTILELASTRIPSYIKNIDPYFDIQILTPTRKGMLGSVELNKSLQAVLNPESPEKPEKTYGEKIFRKGDKVMQIKNNYSLEWKNLFTMQTSTGVFNGEIGIIDTVDNDRGVVCVIYDNEKYVTYDNSNLDELESAFALTVHKSQGSEFPVVIMPMTSFPPMLATRNLLYTAITRAKTLVVLVGNQNICNSMVDNNQSVKRSSGLSARLQNLWDLQY